MGRTGAKGAIGTGATGTGETGTGVEARGGTEAEAGNADGTEIATATATATDGDGEGTGHSPTIVALRPSAAKARNIAKKKKKKSHSAWDKPPDPSQNPQLAALAAGAAAAGAGAGAMNQLALQLAMQQNAQMHRQVNTGNRVPQLNRIYVGNVPVGTVEDDLKNFFNNIMEVGQGPSREPGDSVLQVYLNIARRFAFIELRNPEEAMQAMELDQIKFKGHPLKIGRPANFDQMALDKLRAGLPPPPKLNLEALGMQNNLSTQVENGPNKLYCAGLPNILKDQQVKQLFESYGPLRALYLPKDPATDLCRGWAFFQYKDESVSDAAIAGLDGLAVGENKLQVRRAEQKAQDPIGAMSGMTGMGAMMGGVMPGMSGMPGVPGLAPALGGANPALLAAAAANPLAALQNPALLSGLASAAPAAPSKVVSLLQMVTEDDLKDPEEYDEILEDVKTECQNYGNVVSVVIPKPGEVGVGKVFVAYSAVEEAQKAIQNLQGRTFAERVIIAGFFPEDKFQAKDLA